MLNISNQQQVATNRESEYEMQAHNLFVALDELIQTTALLTDRLGPIKSPTPEQKNPSPPVPPDSPMSPVCDTLRQAVKKIKQVDHVLHEQLSQIQI